MKNYKIQKMLLIAKITVISVVSLITAVSFLPLVITDVYSYETINKINKGYDGLYVGGNLSYSVLMQCVLDTANDFNDSYSNKELVNKSYYQKEVDNVATWKSINYQGKDKLLKNVSNIMVTFDYAPAKASNDLKLLLESRGIRTVILLKAISYKLRFEDPMFYLIIRLSLVLVLLGVTTILFIKRQDDWDFYEDDEDLEEYWEDADYSAIYENDTVLRPTTLTNATRVKMK